MKKLFLFLLLAPVVAFTGCSSDNDDETTTPVEDSLTVSSSALSFDFEGGNKTFAITANVSWTVSSNETWCMVNTAEGSDNATITVTVASWDGEASRTATITVTGGGITRTVSVTQTPEGEEPEPVDEVPAKATISGDASGTTSVILTATASGATSFVWYNGTTEIGGATSASYTVTATGTYYAAGVNDAGMGEKSEGKTVTITPAGGDDTHDPFEYADLLSAYTATGTPYYYGTGAPTWSGDVFQPSDGSTDYYGMTSAYSNTDNLYAWFDIIGSELYIDDYYALADGTLEDGTYVYVYTGVIYTDFSGYAPEYSTGIKWNSSARTLTFDRQNGGQDIMIGLVAVDEDGYLAALLTDMYTDIVLTLDGTRGAAFSGTVVDTSNMMFDGKPVNKGKLKSVSHNSLRTGRFFR